MLLNAPPREPSLAAAPAPARHAETAAWVAAAVVPSALAYNMAPSPTLFNQVAAVGCFGLVLISVSSARAVGPATALRHTAALQAAMGLAAAAALWSWLGGVWPAGLALSALGLLAMAMALAAAGSAVPASGALSMAFFAAWLAAGTLSAMVGCIQVFAPDWGDGTWIAHTSLPGRAVGNMRQPNHLSSLLLWSAVAVVPLAEAGRLKRGPCVALFAFIVLGITLSGSRTGLVGIGILALWGLLDHRLSRFSRGLLLAAPPLCALSWGLTSWWSAAQHAAAVGAAAREIGGDISASRFAIWRDTLELIRSQPWLGVGFGEFNFAWSLTPLPNRPVAFFDHTHNLLLQLAVELGLPLAALVLALLAVALYQAWRRSTSIEGAAGSSFRAAFVVVLLMAIHSELEYPLWYAHFLLPTAFTWGLCLGCVPKATPAAAAPGRWPVVCGVAMLIAAALVLIDYRRVVVIFSPPHGAAPLADRIADGQRSWFFAHHADYAAATTADRPADAMAAFTRAPHHLLDTRLMVAWAEALAQSGEVDRARYLAARLREFRNPASDEFFAPCSDTSLQPRPFQCEPPEKPYSWRDFR